MRSYYKGKAHITGNTAEQNDDVTGFEVAQLKVYLADCDDDVTGFKVLLITTLELYSYIINNVSSRMGFVQPNQPITVCVVLNLIQVLRKIFKTKVL